MEMNKLVNVGKDMDRIRKLSVLMKLLTVARAVLTVGIIAITVFDIIKLVREQ